MTTTTLSSNAKVNCYGFCYVCKSIMSWTHELGNDQKTSKIVKTTRGGRSYGIISWTWWHFNVYSFNHNATKVVTLAPNDSYVYSIFIHSGFNLMLYVNCVYYIFSYVLHIQYNHNSIMVLLYALRTTFSILIGHNVLIYFLLTAALTVRLVKIHTLSQLYMW